MGDEKHYKLFGVSNGLPTAKHRERMGTAVWLYLWLLAHQTDKDGGVMYERPLDAAVICADLGCKPWTVRQFLRSLEVSGYVNVTRTAKGPVVKICNPKRRFGTVKNHCDDGEISPRGEKSPPKAPSTVKSHRAAPLVLNINNNQSPPIVPPFENPLAENDFDRYWQTYPKKTRQHEAGQAWVDIVMDAPDPEAEAVRVLAGVEGLKAAIERGALSEEFAPNARDFIRDKRYLDDWANLKAAAKKSRSDEARERYLRRINAQPQ